MISLRGRKKKWLCVSTRDTRYTKKKCEIAAITVFAINMLPKLYEELWYANYKTT